MLFFSIDIVARGVAFVHHASSVRGARRPALLLDNAGVEREASSFRKAGMYAFSWLKMHVIQIPVAPVFRIAARVLVLTFVVRVPSSH